MKVRQGFVSNSSSSSFIIGCKGKLTETKIMEAMGITETKNSLIYPFAKKIVEFFVNKAEIITKTEYMDGMGYEEESEIEEDVLAIFNSNMDLYMGFASDDTGGVEDAICGMDFDYVSPTLVIKKEERY